MNEPDNAYDGMVQEYEQQLCELQEQLDAEKAVQAAQMRDRVAQAKEVERLTAENKRLREAMEDAGSAFCLVLRIMTHRLK